MFKDFIIAFKEVPNPDIQATINFIDILVLVLEDHCGGLLCGEEKKGWASIHMMSPNPRLGI